MSQQTRLQDLIVGIRAKINTFTTRLGAANGIATLDATGKLTTSQRPAGGSFTPLDYLAPVNAGNVVAGVNALIADMLAKGQMTPPPMFAVSGQITGAGVDAVALSLVGTTTYNTVSDIAGNFSFPAALNDTYTLTAARSGYFYTPASRSVVVNNAPVTAQNFTGALSLASQETSANHVLIPGSGQAYILKKVGRTLEAATFDAISFQAVYGQCVHNGRLFVPIYGTNTLLVYNESNLFASPVATINTSTTFDFAQPFRVFSNGTQLCIVGTNNVRFFTYNNVTETATALGTVINTTVAMTDAVTANNKVYITSSFGGGIPARNLTVIDFGTFAITTFNVAAYLDAAINFIGAGDDALYVGNGYTGCVLDATTLAVRGSVTDLAAQQQGRTSYSNGHFYFTQSGSGGLYRANKDTGVVTFVSGLTPAFGSLFGSVADGNFVYVIDNTGAKMYVVNTTTFAQDGAAITLPGTFAYLKN
jgi:hypothetical protein